MKKGYVQTSQGQVHFRRDGDQGPYLFLFHESPLSSRQFERCLPLLGRSVRAVAFDTPGYGASDPPTEVIAIADYAAWLFDTVNELDDGPFAIGAVHTGASIAVELARLAGDRVTHVVFSGLPLLTPEQRQAFSARIEPPEVRRDGSHLKDAWDRRLAGWGEETDLETLHMALVEMQRVYERYDWGFRAVFGHDPQPALEALACPVYFLNAEHDSLAGVDRKAAELVGAKVKMLAGVRGQLPWRAPEAYAKEVLAFIGAA
jgi:pimeloyl-ACP methyl ester carboxylesterase